MFVIHTHRTLHTHYTLHTTHIAHYIHTTHYTHRTLHTHYTPHITYTLHTTHITYTLHTAIQGCHIQCFLLNTSCYSVARYVLRDENCGRSRLGHSTPSQQFPCNLILAVLETADTNMLSPVLKQSVFILIGLLTIPYHMYNMYHATQCTAQSVSVQTKLPNSREGNCCQPAGPPGWLAAMLECCGGGGVSQLGRSIPNNTN